MFTVLKFIASILATIIYYVFDWIVTCGIFKLITLCFNWTFTWKIATGIWLVVYLVRRFCLSIKYGSSLLKEWLVLKSTRKK